MVGFVIDFTDRRAQREALRASEELFRRATMAARGMIFEVDYVSGHVKRFGAERVLGYDGEELGHSREKWVERMHPEDVARFNAARPRESTEGHSSPLEYRMKHKAGHWIWLRGAGITLTDGNGKPTRRIGFVQAIEAPEYLLPGPDSKTSG